MLRRVVAELVVDSRCELAECPTWHEPTRSLWWTDIHGRALHRFEPASAHHDIRPLGDRLGSFAFTESGGMVAAFVDELGWLDPATLAFEALTAIEPELAETRSNDGRPDRNGGFVFGTMHEDGSDRRPLGSLYQWRLGGELRRLRSGIRIANSISFSPDGATIYYCCTPEKVIWAARYHADDGVISGERVLIDLATDLGSPDGSTVDADGCLWNAQWGGSRVARYTPDGRLDTVVDLPVPHVSAPVFGGRDLTTLYVTTAREHMTPDHPAWHHSGSIFAADLGAIATGLVDTPVHETRDTVGP
jgi:L-arabinonolactonase